MDSQIRDFYQRIVRAFEAPFKVRKERNPRRDAEETLESQTGPFQLATREGQQTDITQGNIIPVGKPVQDLATEGLGANGNSSRISTTHATEVGNETAHPISPDTPDGRNEPRLTDGSSRVVLASDGTKDCMALLLTQKLITEFQYFTEEKCKFESAATKLEEANRKADMAATEMRALRADIEETQDPDLIQDLQKDVETQNQIFTINTAREESLKSAVSARRMNLQHSQLILHNILSSALQEAKLLSLPTAEIDEFSPSEAADNEEDSLASPNSVESIVSGEELFRRKARQDLLFARQYLFERQLAFDNRQDDYERQCERFHDALANGTTGCTQSMFDCLAVEATRELTGALIDAEFDEESALERAKALGVLVNVGDQESNFMSEFSDGYRESQEASMEAAVDRNFITAWTDTVEDAQSEDTKELQEPDEWDAKTVGISDSVSQVDYSRNRRRIDRWREMCEQ